MKERAETPCRRYERYQIEMRRWGETPLRRVPSEEIKGHQTEPKRRTKHEKGGGKKKEGRGTSRAVALRRSLQRKGSIEESEDAAEATCG